MAENGKKQEYYVNEFDEVEFYNRVTPAEQAEATAVRASVDPDDEDHAVEAEGAEDKFERWLIEGIPDKDYGNDVYPPGFDDQYDIDEEA